MALMALMVGVDPWLHAIRGPRRAYCRDGERRGDTSSQACRAREPPGACTSLAFSRTAATIVPDVGGGVCRGLAGGLCPGPSISWTLTPTALCLLKAVRLQKVLL